MVDLVLQLGQVGELCVLDQTHLFTVQYLSVVIFHRVVLQV